MKLIRKNKKGFTLVELIVVIAILAILALILIPAITGYIAKAEQSRVDSNARALYSVAVLKASETGANKESVQTEVNGQVATGDTATVYWDHVKGQVLSVKLESDKGVDAIAPTNGPEADVEGASETD